jgi:hypothetical protein
MVAWRDSRLNFHFWRAVTVIASRWPSLQVSFALMTPTRRTSAAYNMLDLQFRQGSAFSRAAARDASTSRSESGL